MPCGKHMLWISTSSRVGGNDEGLSSSRWDGGWPEARSELVGIGSCSGRLGAVPFLSALCAVRFASKNMWPLSPNGTKKALFERGEYGAKPRWRIAPYRCFRSSVTKVFDLRWRFRHSSSSSPRAYVRGLSLFQNNDLRTRTN